MKRIGLSTIVIFGLAMTACGGPNGYTQRVQLPVRQPAQQPAHRILPRPIVNVISPSGTVEFLSNSFQISGTASDANGVAGVWVKVNAGSFVKQSGTTNWLTNLSGFYSGTNTIKVYAIDVSNNCSVTNAFLLIYKPYYIWTKTFGGTGMSRVYSVLVDKTGNVYECGSFGGTLDFDPDPVIADNKTGVAFFTKFNADGSYGWAKTSGQSGMDLAEDASGNFYLVGYFSGTADFDPAGTTDNKTSAGQCDICVTKINADGSYAWTKTYGGTEQDYGYSVAVDPAKNVYIAGNFQGTADFDPGAGISNISSAGDNDVFLTKINANGSNAWTKRIGGIDSRDNLLRCSRFYVECVCSR